MDPAVTLVCFAVKEEAKFFRAANCRTLITGMGKTNAARSFQKELTTMTPALVLTCGFAGGLNPGLSLGDVVFQTDVGAGLAKRLSESGAAPGVFHCSDRVAITAVEKKSLRASTNADAVEMESAAIRAICREKKIPATTVRVISDAANEDLPLDFNALMTPDYRLSMAKLLGNLMREPQKIPQLLDFQKRTVFAARRLAAVLEKLLAGG
jgi:adenosylhomocysteine nucleosidase